MNYNIFKFFILKLYFNKKLNFKNCILKLYFRDLLKTLLEKLESIFLFNTILYVSICI